MSPIQFSILSDPQKILLLEKSTLLQKAAIELVPATGLDPGFYSFPYVLGSQENEWYATCHRPFCPEHLFCGSSFQNGNQPFYFPSYVDRFPGASRCLFPLSYSPSLTDEPQSGRPSSSLMCYTCNHCRIVCSYLNSLNREMKSKMLKSYENCTHLQNVFQILGWRPDTPNSETLNIASQPRKKASV